MTNQNTQNGHGFFRKKKWAKGLASGIALGAVVTISSAAYADDATNTVETQPEVTVVSDSNATNLAETQADNSQSHTDLTNQSGEQTGQLTETVTSDGLDQSVSDAKQAGVEVDENGTVTHSSYADAQADLAKQKEVVDQVAETQKEVDNVKATAEEAAKAAGVEVSNEASKSAKTYTSVEDAKADAQKQVDNLFTVTEVQKQVNDQLPKAVEAATASGVKVTVKAGAKTSDAKQALDKLANQVASLQEAQTTQNTITNTMAQALTDAKKAGVTVNTSGSKSYSDLAQALADAQAQVAKLTEFKETQESIDAAIKQSADNAKASGVTVSTGETKTYTSVEEAQADSAKQTSSLDNVVATQKEADKVISDLTKQAQKAGLDLTKGESKSYGSIDEAKQDLAKQEQALKDAETAKTKAETTNSTNKQAAEAAQVTANKAINDAVAKATASGTTVTNAGTIEATVEEAQKIAQEQADKVNEVATKNEQIQQENAAKKNDFLQKAKALNLQIDTSGKYVKYMLMDQPQERFVRDRTLSKKGKFSLKKIKEQIATNEVVYDLNAIKEKYDEEQESKQDDFELQVTIEPWQVQQLTSQSIYVPITFGLDRKGTVSIPARMLDQNEDGTFTAFVKKNDFFYFLNADHSEQNRFINGTTLIKQLSAQNGEMILTKNKNITNLDRLVDEFNFLAINKVTNSKQFEELQAQFLEQLEETDKTLDVLDEKMTYLNKLMGALSDYQNNIVPSEVSLELLEKGKIDKNTKLEELQKEIKELQIERDTLKKHRDKIVKDYDFAKEMKEEYEEMRYKNSKRL